MDISIESQSVPFLRQWKPFQVDSKALGASPAHLCFLAFCLVRYLGLILCVM